MKNKSSSFFSWKLGLLHGSLCAKRRYTIYYDQIPIYAYKTYNWKWKHCKETATLEYISHTYIHVYLYIHTLHVCVYEEFWKEILDSWDCVSELWSSPAQSTIYMETTPDKFN